ncbi:Ubiquitin-like modifier-activating enzyme 1 [Tritrichomonas foetus]|uniref:Ubiquitin-like modifier-activating enzyme 1 n=1 Tax=Tritrichomonas foetus TaxID=1144522 RepID=A0A1J4JV73_9EUKA|nr:Ubiquitin-like modifier-activating enzyme 1 [Tritrichomonas foetus]|eukprot:OHT02907.1 Ubiquitin-like modifier-activating enzyme 1 [Tritrichomonas foetus]
MSNDNQIDEELYSRQIYVLGIEAMKRMANSTVLISGLGGLGVEIAKNVILAGVKSLTIHDTKKAIITDVGSQFYISENDIGKNRATASLQKLQELNQHVTVLASEEPDLLSIIKGFNTVVVTEPLPHSKLIQLSNFCHSNNICFIAAETSGVFGYIFNDFGPAFQVNDPRGEIPSRFMIEFITNSEKGIVTCADRAHHNLTDGDFVKFEEVSGMTELNGNSYKVTVINSYRFQIDCDTTKFHPYEMLGSGGYGNQIIPPSTVKFTTLEDQLKDPLVLDTDYCNFGHDRKVLLGFIAIHKFMDLHEGKFPTLSDTDEVIQIAISTNSGMNLTPEIDNNIIKLLIIQYNATISPMAAILGGIVGQEVLKSLSGKFLPIVQFLALSYIEALPPDTTYTLKNDRYDNYRIVFGDKQQDRMETLKYFMIGAGAIGCEVLKNWALMGVSTKGDGKVIVTDMDRIEKSNLARQFLFRDNNIGQNKSEVACAVAKTMNKDLRTEAQTKCLEEKTRDFYNDNFYLQLDGVCNALDNIEARLFSDKMCVYYKKPLLESGTLGPKANFQMVIPGLTESYASSADPPEENIPQCTLHNFPSNIDHCCMWGRDVFSGLFEQSADLVNKFLDDPDFVKNTRIAQGNTVLLSNLETIAKQICEDKPTTFADCAKWARTRFEEYFNWRIRDMLHMFPLDSTTKHGTLFWTGSKRPPTPITFDPNDTSYQREFIFAAATIRARVFGIKPGTQEEAMKAAATAEIKEWTPEKLQIETDDDEKNVSAPVIPDDDPRIIAAIEMIMKAKSSANHLNPEKFEKDDDKNNHMDFVASAANLRAINYKINPETKLEIKRIAGSIIPAIATTTAMICGFVCMEMYKVHCIEPKQISDFRSGFINLAISMFSLTEPIAAEKKKFAGVGPEFSPLWDNLTLDGNLTVKQFIDTVKEQWNVRVMTINIGTSQIYTAYMNSAKKRERMPKAITEIYKEITKEPIPDYIQFFKVDSICYNDDMEEVPMPDFILNFRK